MNLRKSSFAALSVVLLLSACKKVEDNLVVLPVELGPSVGAYVLSEGSFSGNDTRLSYYNKTSNTVVGNFYLQQNPTRSDLGGIGNDMILYGSKLYIVMNVSNVVTVLNANNAIFVKNILFNVGGNKYPRYAAAARGKVYVSCSDGSVSVIDTSSLNITKTIAVGNSPEGIAASTNYLYVANSGGANFPNVDSTVSLIDLNTELEIRKIKVGLNPYKVEVNAGGNIFVSAYGNFSTIPPSISFINGATSTSSINLGSNFSYSNIRIAGDIAYLYNNYGGTGTAKVYNSALNTIVRNEFITDGTVIQTPYGLNVDEQNGDVYIADAKDFVTSGTVTCFGSNGVKKFSFSVSPGVSPNTILFKR